MKRFFAKIISLMLVLSMILAIPAWADTETVEPNETPTTDTTKLDIEQYQFMRGESGLAEFEDNKQFLLPIDTTRENRKSFNNPKYNETISLYENAVDNIVVVENKKVSEGAGVSCYFRTIFAVECPEGLSSGVDVMLSRNDTDYIWTAVQGFATVDGVRFRLYVAEYQSVLKPGEVAPASLYQLYLPAEASSADAALFGEGLDVMVITQCIQSEGMGATASEALNHLGDITALNHPFEETGWLMTLLRRVFTPNK